MYGKFESPIFLFHFSIFWIESNESTRKFSDFLDPDKMRKSLIGLILVASLVVSGMALTMKIEPKVEECFSENLAAGDDVEVRWGVQDGGLLDIEVKVRFCFSSPFTTPPSHSLPSIYSLG